MRLSPLYRLALFTALAALPAAAQVEAAIRQRAFRLGGVSAMRWVPRPVGAEQLSLLSPRSVAR